MFLTLLICLLQLQGDYAFDGGTLRQIYSVYVKKRRCD